jgi:hypothetical protein
VEEIASRFVEIEVSSEDREILYRVITYYKGGRVDQELRRMGEGFDKEEMEALLQVLGGGSLRDGIASLILEGKRQIEEIRIKEGEEN